MSFSPGPDAITGLTITLAITNERAFAPQQLLDLSRVLGGISSEGSLSIEFVTQEPERTASGLRKDLLVYVEDIEEDGNGKWFVNWNNFYSFSLLKAFDAPQQEQAKVKTQATQAYKYMAEAIAANQGHCLYPTYQAPELVGRTISGEPVSHSSKAYLNLLIDADSLIKTVDAHDPLYRCAASSETASFYLVRQFVEALRS
jgi:hypothetical protein